MKKMTHSPPEPTQNESSSPGSDSQDVKEEDCDVKDKGEIYFEIPNFSKCEDYKLYSSSVVIDNNKWRILCFPRGNDTGNSQQISLYLDFEEASTQPPGWCRFVIFSLIVQSSDGIDSPLSIAKEAHHRFFCDESDWGFTSFAPLSEIYDPSKKRLVNDTLRIVAKVSVQKGLGSLWAGMGPYDSKAETGYVGLKNQGATCYMNSLLQTLFFTNKLRLGVYMMPTENDDPVKSVALALQRVFYELQISDTPVGTTDLTKSFGWDAIDSFMQHDVQEFNRVLCDNLEKKMKGTFVDGMIADLFEGKSKSYIKCVNVNYESSRIESFYDIQLNVKGMKDVMESFRNYIQVEDLNGDNKYHAEGHGLQDAKMGVIFQKFPSVLQLQLKRFEYDMNRDMMVKVNDRYEFSERIQLDEFLEAPNPANPANYVLHAVLVHSGDIHSGHYVVFLRPDRKKEWHKYDDDRVMKVPSKEALEENFGIDEAKSPNGPLTRLPRFNLAKLNRKYTNAYMLVYIRESSLHDVLRPVSHQDIPKHLVDRFEREKSEEARKHREFEEMHLYTTIMIASEDSFRNHHGFDLLKWDPVADPSIKPIKVLKTITLSDFYLQVAKLFHLPVDHIRLWNFVTRQNKTIRPDAPLLLLPPTPHHQSPPHHQQQQQSGNQTSVHQSLPLSKLVLDSGKLFLERADESKMNLFQDHIVDKTIALFFKYYQPIHEKMTYVGYLIVDRDEKVANLLDLMRKMAQLPPNTPLLVYEEIKPSMIDPVKCEQTLKSSELVDGDILCFQVASNLLPPPQLNPTLASAPKEAPPTLEYPLIPDFFASLNNRLAVQFRKLENPHENDFVLELSKKMNYDTFARKVADHLAIQDHLKLRFTTYNQYSDQPKATVKRNSNATLNDILNYSYPASNILYYEKLAVSIQELENNRVLKFAYFNSLVEEVAEFQILISKKSLVADLFPKIIQELEAIPPPTSNPTLNPSITSHNSSNSLPTSLSAPSSAPNININNNNSVNACIRILEQSNGKITRILTAQDRVELLAEHIVYRVEIIPEEEINLQESQKLIRVCHFHKEVYRTHSHPFLLLIQDGEPLAAIKERIQKKLNVPEKHFEKYKFFLLSFTSARPFQDDSCLSIADFGPNECLGIEHVDRNPPKSKFSPFEKPVVIHN